MAVPKTIDVLAGIRSKAVELSRWRGGGTGFKSFVEINVPTLGVVVDEPAIAGEFARVVVEILRSQVLAGQLGRTPASATMERRRYREEQGLRDGEVAPRYKKQRGRMAGMKAWKKRFRSARAGTFNPANPPVRGVFGVESGMLASSLMAFLEGASWRIYAADNRGLKDRSSMSAIDRVFRGVNVAGVLSRGGLGRSIQRIGAALVLTRGKRALQALLGVGQRLKTLQATIEGVAEREPLDE